MTIQYLNMTPAESLLFTLQQAEQNISKDLYYIASTYLADAETIKRNLDWIAVSIGALQTA